MFDRLPNQQLRGEKERDWKTGSQAALKVPPRDTFPTGKPTPLSSSPLRGGDRRRKQRRLSRRQRHIVPRLTGP